MKVPSFLYNLTKRRGETGSSVWEEHTIHLYRKEEAGFGFAVCGGREGEGGTQVVVEDVLSGGPAEGRLRRNDRIVAANNICLESLEYGQAIQVLRSADQRIQLTVRRKGPSSISKHTRRLFVSLFRQSKKQDFGVTLGCNIYIADIALDSLASQEGRLQAGDTVLEVGDVSLHGVSLSKANRLLRAAKKELRMVVERESGSDTDSHCLLVKVTNEESEKRRKQQCSLPHLTNILSHSWIRPTEDMEPCVGAWETDLVVGDNGDIGDRESKHKYQENLLNYTTDKERKL